MFSLFPKNFDKLLADNFDFYANYLIRHIFHKLLIDYQILIFTEIF